MTDTEAPDFFRDPSLVSDPYPFLDALREQCPVQPENHHGAGVLCSSRVATTARST